MTAAILVFSLIPVLCFTQGTIQGQGKTTDHASSQVVQVDNGPVQPNQGTNVAMEQSTSADPVVTEIQPSVQQNQGVVNTVVKTEAINQSSAPTSAPALKNKPSSAPAVSTATVNASGQQSEMLEYINTARAQAGLSPLVLAAGLNSAAYTKSKDMAINGYFSHYSPTYGSPFEMLTSLGISYGTAGENIAKNFSVKGAQDAFMNSPGHKANILNPDFKKVGLGFYKDSTYLYVTQIFTD